MCDNPQENLTSADMSETEIISVSFTNSTTGDRDYDDFLHETFLEYATKRVKIKRFILYKNKD